jgi:hypothetical protein
LIEIDITVPGFAFLGEPRVVTGPVRRYPKSEGHFGIERYPKNTYKQFYRKITASENYDMNRRKPLGAESWKHTTCQR